MTHSPQILQIDTVRAYHSGPRLIVEVDIVMDPEDTLRGTHDIAEELQIKLESLPDVERAYVHVDYETDHRPEHFLKKELWDVDEKDGEEERVIGGRALSWQEVVLLVHIFLITYISFKLHPLLPLILTRFPSYKLGIYTYPLPSTIYVIKFAPIMSV